MPPLWTGMDGGAAGVTCGIIPVAMVELTGVAAGIRLVSGARLGIMPLDGWIGIAMPGVVLGVIGMSVQAGRAVVVWPFLPTAVVIQAQSFT